MGRTITHCPQCGKENPPDALFCHYCKNELEGVTAEPQVPSSTLQPSGRMDNTFLMYLIAILVMGIIASVYLLLVR